MSKFIETPNGTTINANFIVAVGPVETDTPRPRFGVQLQGVEQILYYGETAGGLYQIDREREVEAIRNRFVADWMAAFPVCTH